MSRSNQSAVTANDSHQIIITAEDHERLLQLLHCEFSKVAGCKTHLNDLLRELYRASVVDPVDVPSDVITMDCVVELTDIDDSEREIYTLVYPESENSKEKMLSILAPIGTAILGYRVGDVVSWKVPIGVRRMKVESILFQPEHHEREARVSSLCP